MRRLYRTILGLLFVLFCYSSCIIAVIDTAGSEEGIPVERFHRLIPFSEGGSLAVENGAGDIEIIGWEKNEIEISAEKIMRAGPRIGFLPGKKNLPGIDIQYEEDYASIRTEERGRALDEGRINYRIRVPHHIFLDEIQCRTGQVFLGSLYGAASVNLRSGRLIVENYSGSLNLHVGEGEISAELVDLRREDEIRIDIDEGDIRLQLQDTVPVVLEANALQGEIDSEFEGERIPGRGVYRMILGEEGAVINLTTLNGDIFIEKIQI